MRPRLRVTRSGIWLAAATLSALVAALIMARAATGEAVQGTIVVARERLPAGLVIDEDIATGLLAVVPGPALHPSAGLFSDPVDVLGRRVSAPVGAGEAVSQAALGGAPGSSPAPLSVGERAVAVPLSRAGLEAAGLAAGARVDVVASSGEGPAGRSALIVVDAEVLAVAHPQGSEGIDGSGDVLLRVSSAQALRITAAVNFSREVRLLARPPEEVGVADGPREASAP